MSMVLNVHQTNTEENNLSLEKNADFKESKQDWLDAQRH